MIAEPGPRDASFDVLVDDDPARLYDEAPCGFLSTTPDGTILRTNATLCEWLGVGPGDLVGLRSFVDLLTPGGRIYHETHYAPMLRMHGRVRELALDLRRDDGRRIPVLVNATLERGPDGEARAIRVVVFDASERRRYERELVAAKERAQASEEVARDLARTLQQTLLPPTAPEVPGLQLATAYEPATDGLLVGGDFYDVFPLGPDDWGVILGDVCGKGAEAAVVTALARWTMRAAAVAFAEPSRALANLDDVLRNHETDRFCTAVVLRLRRDGHSGSWRVTLSVGGHMPPMRLLRDGGSTPVAAAGPVVGVVQSPEFVDVDVELLPGEGLLLFTDGVTETRDGRDFFDDEGVRDSVRRHGTEPHALVAGLLADVARFRGATASRDDIVVLALRVPDDDVRGAVPG